MNVYQSIVLLIDIKELNKAVMQKIIKTTEPDLF